jgi:hypothetical protein
MLADSVADKLPIPKSLEIIGNMSTAASSNHQPKRLGTLRAVIIAGVAAFILGGLCAFISKAVSNSSNAPVASSASTSTTM